MIPTDDHCTDHREEEGPVAVAVSSSFAPCVHERDCEMQARGRSHVRLGVGLSLWLGSGLSLGPVLGFSLGPELGFSQGLRSAVHLWAGSKLCLWLGSGIICDWVQGSGYKKSSGCGWDQGSVCE